MSRVLLIISDILNIYGGNLVHKLNESDKMYYFHATKQKQL